LPVENHFLPSEIAVLPAETGMLPAENQFLPAETEILPAEKQFLPAEKQNYILLFFLNKKNICLPLRRTQNAPLLARGNRLSIINVLRTFLILFI
jgi:hypothetical protein